MKNSVKLKEIGELIMKISVIMITRVVAVKEINKYTHITIDIFNSPTIIR